MIEKKHIIKRSIRYSSSEDEANESVASDWISLRPCFESLNLP